MPCEECPKASHCLYYEMRCVEWCDYWQKYWEHNTLTVTTYTEPKEGKNNESNQA